MRGKSWWVDGHFSEPKIFHFFQIYFWPGVAGRNPDQSPSTASPPAESLSPSSPPGQTSWPSHRSSAHPHSPVYRCSEQPAARGSLSSCYRLLMREQAVKISRCLDALHYAVSVLLMASCACLQAQTSPAKPCASTEHPGWRTYTNREFRFCIRYPPTYRELPPGPNDQFGDLRRVIGTLELILPSSKPAEDSSASASNIRFLYLSKPVTVRDLQAYAPTGYDAPPEPIQIGHRTFYFYGAGGGGALYPDLYFIQIKGHFLNIGFSGPYPEGYKYPSEETQKLEPQILATFRTY
jgi:hypothetical protein